MRSFGYSESEIISGTVVSIAAEEGGQESCRLTGTEHQIVEIKKILKNGLRASVNVY